MVLLFPNAQTSPPPKKVMIKRAVIVNFRLKDSEAVNKRKSAPVLAARWPKLICKSGLRTIPHKWLTRRGCKPKDAKFIGKTRSRRYTTQRMVTAARDRCRFRRIFISSSQMDCSVGEDKGKESVCQDQGLFKRLRISTIK